MFVTSSQQENRSLWLTITSRLFFGSGSLSAASPLAPWLMNALGISAVSFLPDGHKRVSAVLSFRLASWNNL
jgi:hypothetical protein